MGGAVSSSKDNDDLVDHLVESSFLKTPAIQRAFRSVDRGYYCPPLVRRKAYKDMAWKKGNIHLSAPCIYAVVLESFQLEPGLSFLNIGSGTGYLSTVVGLILGTFGVNHGIELYRGVVNFAYEILENFMQLSGAIDLHDFCEPKFTVANALTLDTVCHQYDRVYCSAACSEEYELYIKNLVKVGGILIMPINGKLVKFVRIDESEWKSEKIMSTNFASLKSLPPNQEPLIHPTLDDISPPMLQHICRSRIRSVLRDAIHKEHPDIEIEISKRARYPRKKIERIVIPFYDEIVQGGNVAANAEEAESQEYTMDSRLPAGMTIFLESFLRRHAEVQLLRDVHDRFSGEEVQPDPPLERSNSSSLDGSSSSSLTPPSRRFFTRHETPPKKDYNQPSGSKLTSPNETSNTEQSFNFEILDLSNKSSKQNLKRKRSDDDKPGTSIEPDDSIMPLEMQKKFRALGAAEFDRLVAQQQPPLPRADFPEDGDFVNLMAKKIGKLPLPMLLLRYVNYNRDNYFIGTNWWELVNKKNVSFEN